MLGRRIGNYVVRALLGQGGMGAVYLAEHHRIGRRVAIKVLKPEHGARADLAERFFHEARAANDVRSEHIVDVLDFDELEDGRGYLVMEWLEGRSLARAIAGPSERIDLAPLGARDLG